MKSLADNVADQQRAETPRHGKRAPGEGTIDQLPSGRYRVRMRLASGVRRTRTVDTLEEAERMRDASVAVLAESQLAPMGALTLRAFGTEFLERRELDGVRAIRTDRSTWRQHIATAPFIDEPLASISEDDVRQWAASLGRKKARAPAKWIRSAKRQPPLTQRVLSRTSQQHALNLLRVAFEAAYEARKVETNVARHVKLPKRPREARTHEPWTFLTTEEIEQTISSRSVSDNERDFMEFVIHQGLRPGEIFGLHWKDVVLEGPRPEIAIRHSWKGPTKSGKPRLIPLHEPARRALLRWRSRCPTPNGLVFPTKTGCRRQRGDSGGWFDRVLGEGQIVRGIKSRAGITRAVRFYDACRHTTASHLVMGSWGPAWSLYDVSHFLGHSDIEVTQRYAHLSPEHLHNKAAMTARRDPIEGSTLGHEA